MSNNIINTVTAQQATIQVYEGATTKFVATALDQSGNPVDLTGYSFQLTVKTKATDTTTQLQFLTTDGSITIGGDSNNVVTFSKISSIKGGTYVYDCVATLPDTVTIQPWLYGTFNVTQSVSIIYS